VIIVYVLQNFTIHLTCSVFYRFILHAKKTGFVVEHDFIMATYLADRVIVFEGSPSIDTTAHTPQTLLAGMNRFLELLGITFRRDPNNFRPRINKNNSVKVSMNLCTSGVGYTLITNLMHWLLFIHKLLLSSTCFEHQVLIFRRT